jgi:F-type H+-transporting ATPase subunit gamma
LAVEALRQIFDTGDEQKLQDQDPKSPHLLIVCSSDRGLCGSIHSSLSKMARQSIRVNKENTSVVVLGDKSKPQVAREGKENIRLAINQVGKNVPSFSEALSVVNALVKESIISPKNSDKITVLFNHFKSMIAYENKAAIIPTLPSIESAPNRPKYELKPEVAQNYLEWTLANSIFEGLVEGYASEMAARRMAMENATKNSEEIVQRLTMKYNRTRQAVITNELVDIITGASAL